MSITGIDLEGKHVVLREDRIAAPYRDITWRTVLATGGFGCSPSAMGRAVFVEHLRDGDKGRFNRDDVERLASDREVEQALAARQPAKRPDVVLSAEQAEAVIAALEHVLDGENHDLDEPRLQAQVEILRALVV